MCLLRGLVNVQGLFSLGRRDRVTITLMCTEVFNLDNEVFIQGGE